MTSAHTRAMARDDPSSPQAHAAAHAGPSAQAERVELVLQQIDQLPTLSPVAQRALAIGSDAHADIDDLVRVIEADPALTSRVLGLCRRAELGLGERVATVRRAAVMLGMDAIRAAILSVAVYDALSAQPQALEPADEPNAFDRAEFWRHCVATACAADALARAHPGLGVPPDEAFVAGLLHDLGKQALDLILPKTYGRVLRLAAQRGLSAADAASRIIGIDHHTAGKRLAEHWALPHALQDAMWLCGQPPEGLGELRTRGVVVLAGAAHDLARAMHIGWSGDGDHLPEVGRIAQRFGLDARGVDAAAADLHAQVAQRCRDLGLDAPDSPGLLLRSITRANAWLSQTNARLEQGQRLAAARGRAIDAIEAFHVDEHAARGLLGTLAAVARSAASVLGHPPQAVLLKRNPADPWQLVRLSASGEVLACDHLAAPPADRSVAACLRPHADGLDLSLAATGLGSWLGTPLRGAEHVQTTSTSQPAAQAGDNGADGPATDAACDTSLVSAARVLAVTPGRCEDAPSISIIHTASPPDRALGALVACWASALAAASRHDGARRLGERLADANRALANARDELADADAMARLGRMAAGAAHEMNNPLTVISGRAQLLLETTQDQDARVVARAIIGASHKLSDLITALRVFADPPSPTPELASLGPLLDRVTEGVAERAGGGELAVRNDAGVRQAVLDGELVSRILIELAVNAVESAGGARLGVRVESLDDQLVFEVSDDGPGLSDRALRHAFDPFFSEKPAGRQPGLGLARARRLAEILGGRLSLTNARTGGAVATLSLPGWRPPEDQPPPPSQADEPAISQHPEAVG